MCVCINWTRVKKVESIEAVNDTYKSVSAVYQVLYGQEGGRVVICAKDEIQVMGSINALTRWQRRPVLFVRVFSKHTHVVRCAINNLIYFTSDFLIKE